MVIFTLEYLVRAAVEEGHVVSFFGCGNHCPGDLRRSCREQGGGDSCLPLLFTEVRGAVIISHYHRRSFLSLALSFGNCT